MSQKTWGGRFSAETHPLVVRFTESVSYDQRLFRHDVRASQAHARMLAEVGLITQEEAVHPVNGVACPQPDVGDDLVVAAAAGVQFAAEVAEFVNERPLDVRVDVFKGGREGKLISLDLAGDAIEAATDFVGLVGR